jgi:NTP pyrophosphatase (non-canonical NTP hydrolase)
VDTETYMDEVLRTYAGSDGMVDQLSLGALGLAGEAGEVVEHVKKFLYWGHVLDASGLVDEIGDVLWYVVLLCHALDRRNGSRHRGAGQRGVSLLAASSYI